MKKTIAFALTLLAANLLTINQTNACTDIRLIAKDGTVLVARSMEFGLDLQSNLRTSPRGRVFTTTAPDGKPGMGWQAKYGFVFLDGLNQDFAVEGMNENGLTYEALFMPGIAEYQTVPVNKDNQALPYMSLGNWILSNFKTIDEVRAALMNTYVFTQMLPGLGEMVFPLHFSIYEQSGKGIVVEYVKGQLTIYDNIGIMTNNPTYDWHINNLNNYLNMSPYNPHPITAGGFTFSSNGQGSGMFNLPGDTSPPSRFVKMSVLMKSSYIVNDAPALLNLAEHIINNVDIPLGISRSTGTDGKEVAELTQWVVFKDLTHKMFYYRTYQDTTLHGVALDKIDFSEKAPRLKMPIIDTQYVIDMTSKFADSKEQQPAVMSTMLPAKEAKEAKAVTPTP